MAKLGLDRLPPADIETALLSHQMLVDRQVINDQFLIDGLEIVCPAGVYHPDSFSSTLFVLRHLPHLRRKIGARVLEVGTGCGTILLCLARDSEFSSCVGVDISDEAVAAATLNAERNRIPAEFRLSDLFSSVAEERFDMIVFNAPLLNKDPEGDIERCLLCDPHGATLGAFVDGLVTHLARDGMALVTISNLGTAAPLDVEQIEITLQGLERFESGFFRALVRAKLR